MNELLALLAAWGEAWGPALLTVFAVFVAIVLAFTIWVFVIITRNFNEIQRDHDRMRRRR